MVTLALRLCEPSRHGQYVWPLPPWSDASGRFIGEPDNSSDAEVHRETDAPAAADEGGRNPAGISQGSVGTGAPCPFGPLNAAPVTMRWYMNC